jgi:hypothetical protein
MSFKIRHCKERKNRNSVKLNPWLQELGAYEAQIDLNLLGSQLRGPWLFEKTLD